MGAFFALLSSLLFGVTNVAVAKGSIYGSLNKYEGLLLTLIINNMINFFILVPIIVVFTSLPDFSWAGIISFIGSGFFTSFLGRVLLFTSIALIGASRAGTLKITAPLFTVLIGIFILGERISIFDIVGIGLILLGVWLITKETQLAMVLKTEKNNGAVNIKQNREDNPDNPCEAVNTDKKQKLLKIGLTIGFISGFSFGAGNVLRKVGLTHYNSPLIGVVIGSLVSLLCLLLLTSTSILKQEKVTMQNIFIRKGSKAYIIAGVASSMAIFCLFISLIYLPVSIVNSLASIEALFIIFIAFILLKKKEIITLALIIGTSVIILGVCLIIL